MSTVSLYPVIFIYERSIAGSEKYSITLWNMLLTVSV